MTIARLTADIGYDGSSSDNESIKHLLIKPPTLKLKEPPKNDTQHATNRATTTNTTTTPTTKQTTKVAEGNQTPSKTGVSFGTTSTRVIPGRKTNKPPTKNSGRGRGAGQKKVVQNPYNTPRPARPAETEVNTLAIKYRATIKFTMFPSQKTAEALKELAADMLQEMQSIDPTTTILPWWPDADDDPIQDASDFPPNEPKLRRYVDRLRVPEFTKGEKTKDVWTSVYYTSNTPPEVYKQSLKHWRHDFLLKDLQCAKSVCVGWAVYSTRNMDNAAIAEYYRQHHNLEIACRWRKVFQPGGKFLEAKMQVNALHFEVATEHQARAKRILYAVYGSNKHSREQFPCGYRLRITPELSQCTNTQLPCVTALLNRQRKFETMHKTIPHYWQSNTLDYKHPELPMTLRQLLMRSATPTDPTNYTFLGIKSTPSVVNMDYLKTNERRALEISQGIISYAKMYFRHWRTHAEYSTRYDQSMPTATLDGIVESLFPAGEVECNSDLLWDMDKDGITTAQDAYLTAIADDNDDLFDFTDMEVTPPQHAPTEEKDRHMHDLIRGHGADSIGTLNHVFHDDLSTIYPEQQQAQDTTEAMEEDEENSGSEDESSRDDLDNESVFTTATMRSIQTAVTTEVMNQVNAHLDAKFEAMQQNMMNMLQMIATNNIHNNQPTIPQQPGQNDGMTDAETHPGGETGHPP
jgi:hypothetical protein